MLGIAREQLLELDAAGVLPAWRATPTSVRRWDRSVLLAYRERARAAAGVPARVENGHAAVRSLLAVVLAAVVVLAGAAAADASSRHDRHGIHDPRHGSIFGTPTCQPIRPLAPVATRVTVKACTR